MTYTVAPILQPPPYVIGTFSEEALGSRGRWGIALGSVASATYVANLAIFVPFGLTQPFLVREVFWSTGATVSGTFDIAIYSTAGTRLASLGSTSLGTASSVNTSTTWTDYTVMPGDYYMAYSSSATTTGIVAWAPVAQAAAACGVGQMTTAHPLPTSATIVPITNALLPYFGLNGYTVAA